MVAQSCQSFRRRRRGTASSDRSLETAGDRRWPMSTVQTQQISNDLYGNIAMQ